MIKNNVQYFQIMVKLGEEEKLSKGNLPLRSQVFAHYLYLRRQKVESGEWNGKAMSRSMMQQEQCKLMCKLNGRKLGFLTHLMGKLVTEKWKG